MKELLNYIIQNLVDHPDEVVITERQRGDDLTLDVSVNSDDMGKVIGRQGNIARNIRQIIRAVGQRQGLRVNVYFKD